MLKINIMMLLMKFNVTGESIRMNIFLKVLVRIRIAARLK